MNVTVHSYLVNSNDSQAHLKFCFAKGASEHPNNVLTHQNSKCFGAVCTVITEQLQIITEFIIVSHNYSEQKNRCQKNGNFYLFFLPIYISISIIIKTQ